MCMGFQMGPDTGHGAGYGPSLGLSVGLGIGEEHGTYNEIMNGEITKVRNDPEINMNTFNVSVLLNVKKSRFFFL